MFGSLGFPELMLILVVALIVFGPRRLPEIGRTIGKALGEFKRATDDLKDTLEREVQLEELKKIGPAMTTPYESVSRPKPSYSDVEPEPVPAETASAVDFVDDVVAEPAAAVSPSPVRTE